MARVLDGRVAIVTGASQGQGAAIARRFAREGASVVVTDVLTETGQAVAVSLGERARFVRLDVSSADDWEGAAAVAVDQFGRLDILVNNAGVLHRGTIDETSLDDYLRVIMVNQVGCWLGMKTVHPLMRASGGGAIVNTSSIAGLAAMAGRSAYVASKFAVRAMTRVAALEFGPSNVRVNSIHPGTIATDMVDPEMVAPTVATQPIPRIGGVDEIADLVVFLVSDQSSFCTGSEFVIDGGLTAGMRI
jgi:3alpha(or 20beta)-hydroxysteroid dehydrogenase